MKKKSKGTIDGSTAPQFATSVRQRTGNVEPEIPNRLVGLEPAAVTEDRLECNNHAIVQIGAALKAFQSRDLVAIANAESALRSAMTAILHARSLDHPVQCYQWPRIETSTPLLSVLIPTLVERAEAFSRLLAELHRQVTTGELGDAVEVLTFCDDRQLPVGTKRNSLLMRSRGRFVSFVAFSV